jgi:hypothetical protein
VVVNIEAYDRIWIFAKEIEERDRGKLVRPGEERPRYKGQPVVKPGQGKAAKRADGGGTGAVEVPELIHPQRRRASDPALSQRLRNNEE